MEENTFDKSFFELLKRAEENHFWFQVRRKWILHKIQKFSPPPAILLEVGCGTGNVSSFLARRGYEVTGCEFYAEALDEAWPGFLKVKGDAENLPFEDQSFDIVGLFDIIEHFHNDLTLLMESARVARKGGILALTVPARGELWSSADEKSFHKRRYTKEALNSLISKAGLKVLKIEYMFMSLYAPMKYMRMKGLDISDQFKINPFFNSVLKKLFNLERFVSNFLPLPIGTSLIAISRKEP